jgi:hypothetical protein
MFAAIPLIFAAQQAAEGTVWLTIGGPPDATVQRLAVDAFLGLALVVWPVWAPVSMRLLEQSAPRRLVLTALSFFGGVVAAFGFTLLVRWQPVAVIAGHSLRYDRAASSDTLPDIVILLAYALPTVVPLFVSSATMARTIGATLVVSVVAAALVQLEALTSVWCFFAAILSGLVLVAVMRPAARAAVYG